MNFSIGVLLGLVGLAGVASLTPTINFPGASIPAASAAQPPADGNWWAVSRSFPTRCITLEAPLDTPQSWIDSAHQLGGAAQLVQESDGVLVILDEEAKSFKFFPSKAACNTNLIARGYLPKD